MEEILRKRLVCERFSDKTFEEVTQNYLWTRVEMGFPKMCHINDRQIDNVGRVIDLSLENHRLLHRTKTNGIYT